MKKMLVSICLLLTLAVGGIAVAQGPGPRGPFGAQGVGPVAALEFIRSLDLREDQVQYLLDIQQIVAEARGERAAGAGDHAKAIAEKLESGEDFASEDAEALIDQHFDRAQETANAVAVELTGFLNSLDAEQRALVAERLDLFGHLRAAAADHGGFGHGRLLRQLLAADR
ncbi:MAG: Spy/CpxP family protein refolding chaperone [Acidobacteriota bacterium]